MEEIVKLLENNKQLQVDIVDNCLIIKNKDNNKTIEIIKEDNEEYIISFATQHRHFDNDIEEIEYYLDSIINDNILPIEFFISNNDIFGGEISKELFNNLSIKKLANYFNCDEAYISSIDCEIHSWSGKYDIKRLPVKNLK